MNRSIFQASTVLLLALAGCKSTVRIESDTSWSGSISAGNTSTSFDGSGDATFDVSGDPVCWSFQKQTERGSLRAYYQTTAVLGPDKAGDATTTAVYGLVGGCNR